MSQLDAAAAAVSVYAYMAMCVCSFLKGRSFLAGGTSSSAFIYTLEYRSEFFSHLFLDADLYIYNIFISLY